VGRFCVQKDHHPEWHALDAGRTVSIKLTSHFAANKVTLFDFQLAEHMNQQYKVTQRWFTQYPLISSKSWTSFKIFLAGFVLINFAFQIGTHWGNYYPSAAQRGQKSQAAQYRPLIVAPYRYTPGQADQADLYAQGHVDEYAFKNSIFSSRNYF
jgi:hypothetical protein